MAVLTGAQLTAFRQAVSRRTTALWNKAEMNSISQGVEDALDANSASIKAGIDVSAPFVTIPAAEKDIILDELYAHRGDRVRETRVRAVVRRN